MSKYALNVLAIAAFVIGLASPGYAQAPPAGAADQHPTGTILNPTWDASIGYQLLHVPDETLPLGFAIDGARNFGPWSLVAEAGWSRHSEGDDDLGTDTTSNFFHVGAGPRWTGRSTSSVWPFAQVLAGVVHRRFDAEFDGVDLGGSDTKFMVQPGAGVVFVAGDGWGIVGQVDYRRLFLDEDEDGESGENDFRVFVGLRVILD